MNCARKDNEQNEEDSENERVSTSRQTVEKQFDDNEKEFQTLHFNKRNNAQNERTCYAKEVFD